MAHRSRWCAATSLVAVLTVACLGFTSAPAFASPILCGDTIQSSWNSEEAIPNPESWTACVGSGTTFGTLPSGDGTDRYEVFVFADADSIFLSITSFDRSFGTIAEMPDFLTLALTSINWFGMPSITIQNVIDNSPYLNVVSFGADFLTVAFDNLNPLEDQTVNPGDSITIDLGRFDLVPTPEDVTAVPEPATLALLGAGLASLIARRRQARAS